MHGEGQIHMCYGMSSWFLTSLQCCVTDWDLGVDGPPKDILCIGEVPVAESALMVPQTPVGGQEGFTDD